MSWSKSSSWPQSWVERSLRFLPLAALLTTIASYADQQKTLTGQIAALPADSPDRGYAQAQLIIVNDSLSAAAANRPATLPPRTIA